MRGGGRVGRLEDERGEETNLAIVGVVDAGDQELDLIFVGCWCHLDYLVLFCRVVEMW